MNRATTAETKFTELKTEHDQLVITNRAAIADQIDADLATHGITEEAKIGQLRPVLAAMKNRKERTDFLAAIAPVKDGDKKETAKQITNRATAKAPGGQEGETDASKAGAQKHAAVISNRAAQLRAANPTLSVADAYQRAQQEYQTTEASN